MRFVSLLGSLTRHAAANPFDVIHRLTEITGAESYFMPAPFFADSIEDKQVLLGQRSLESVFALARAAELVVVGIGEVGPRSHLLTSGMITAEEFAEVERAGAVGELLGRFVDARRPPGGGRRSTSGRWRCGWRRCPAGRWWRSPAAATSRARSRPCCRAGCVTGLITDEATAREVAALGAAARRRAAGFVRSTKATTGSAGHA